MRRPAGMSDWTAVVLSCFLAVVLLLLLFVWVLFRLNCVDPHFLFAVFLLIFSMFNAIVVYTKPYNFLNFFKGRPKKERNPTSFRKLKPHHITFNIFQQIWELHNFVSKKMTKPLVTSTISPAEAGTKEFSGVHTWHGVRSWWRAKSLVLQILSIDIIDPAYGKTKKQLYGILWNITK